ncbi:GNAT family N-acetyltransferase [Candidatus Nitrospira neomarina]|uniref:GNAT family N-acetyltransferase n=1 Tax=Candidatus Nitrospira neomarina TaxID=3020899 RepID=A0AA96GRI5_9BACT|nr:GNAT family N-acetyltransferase [Candidatus Nitrospira neomarina]WNM63978.1 GNAT family N-acetyltransferase [Candidatus Nitrospira neomarina]
MIQVEPISTKCDFLTLHDEWEHLLERSEQYSPFLTHEWFQCLLEQYENPPPLYILTVRDGPKLLGIAPLWRTERYVRGIPVKQMEFITNQDTPLVDFIVEKENQRQVLSAILEYFDGTLGHCWDVLMLTQWPNQSPNFKEVLNRFVEGGNKHLLQTASVTPFLAIQGQWDSFLQGHGPRLRKTQRNIANRVSKLPKVEVQCFRQNFNGSVMQEVLQVSRQGWKYQEGKSLANTEDLRRFFSILTMVGDSRGWLMVWLLKTNGVPIAMEYDLESKGKVFALRSDFDEAYKECSPGAYLEAQILQWLFVNGYQEYNYGPGLNAYKLHWADDFRTNVRIDVFNRTLTGRLTWELEGRIVPMCKRIRDWWKAPLGLQQK